MMFQTNKRRLLAFGGIAVVLALGGGFGSKAMAENESAPPNPHKDTIRAAATGSAEARAALVKLNYKSPQQVLAGFNKVVVARGGALKAANFRQENKHNNFLDGGSVSLYVGDPSDSKNLSFWVDIQVYADANLNTVVNANFKVNNSGRPNQGEGSDLRRSLEDEIGISRRFDAVPVPAFIFTGDFSAF